MEIPLSLGALVVNDFEASLLDFVVIGLCRDKYGVAFELSASFIRFKLDPRWVNEHPAVCGPMG